MRLAGTFDRKHVEVRNASNCTLKSNGPIKPLDDTPFGKYTAFSHMNALIFRAPAQENVILP